MPFPGTSRARSRTRPRPHWPRDTSQRELAVVGELEDMEELVSELAGEIRVVGARASEEHVGAATRGREPRYATVVRPVLRGSCHRIARDGVAVLAPLAARGDGIQEVDVHLAVAVA